MTLESWLFGDPAKVLQRKQEIGIRNERACGGCIHKMSVEFRGEVGHFCEYKRHVYGKRCELFEIKKG
jgi:hypothetical protein